MLPPYRQRFALVTIAVFVLAAGVLWASQSASQKVDFGRDVQPILARSCYSCHGDKLQLGGLRLDGKETAWKGGQSGQVIVSGNAPGSILYQRVSATNDQGRMPMGAKPTHPAESAK